MTQSNQKITNLGSVSEGQILLGPEGQRWECFYNKHYLRKMLRRTEWRSGCFDLSGIDYELRPAEET